ncbi:MAG: SAF domain-containing protein [Actinomycetota bacterium]|nr:SAF domain-containing protein [Actinomycetota bacterium]
MNERRYLILAILGALIIGISSYLFLNNFLDKTEILVFSKDIKVGEIIREDDLYLKYFYKNSLPDNYLVDKSEAVGQEIFIERKREIIYLKTC